jgi:transcriptional regulator with XRE-family HTH domain
MNNLRKFREAAGMSQARLAAEARTSQPQIQRLETSKRKLTKEWAERLAPPLKVTAQQLLFDDAPTLVKLVGYVGAGGEAEFGYGQGPFDEVHAPPEPTGRTVAVGIRGQSLGPFFDEWLVYYDDVRHPPTEDLIGKLCVIGLHGGRVLIKKLARSDKRGRWDLLSQFEPPLYGERVEWAAPVKLMQPK